MQRMLRLAASCVLALVFLAVASSRAGAQQLFITSAQIDPAPRPVPRRTSRRLTARLVGG